eukprot:627967-Pleurochrysis_carterae.AAC.1
MRGNGERWVAEGARHGLRDGSAIASTSKAERVAWVASMVASMVASIVAGGGAPLRQQRRRRVKEGEGMKGNERE